MSLSNNHRKLITSLSQKKYRHQYKLFVVEGVKAVDEFLASDFELHLLFATDNYHIKDVGFISVTQEELKKISHLKSPNKVLGIFKIPDDVVAANEGLIVALDAINDPGNLGTILRLCDWFGVTEVVCSMNTVDCFNPKVVQASMGSLTRVSVVYTNLISYLENTETPIFVADMNGENVYKSELPSKGVLVMGNEANGISKEVFLKSTHKISIPRFGNTQLIDSLNVAAAAAILLSEFKR